MASGSDITLYWGDGSPPCWSVLVTLEEKQITGYTDKKLSFDKKENKSPEIMAINPRGELPCCKVGDMILNESLATCLYLEEAFPDQGTALMPKDPKQRAVIWQRITEMYWNFVRRCYKNLVRYMWYTPAEKQDQQRIQQAKEECLIELEIWEGYLRDKGNTNFLVGDSFSMADVTFYPWLAFFIAQGLKLEPRFEKLAAYHSFMKEWPSIKKFWPKKWDGSVDQTALCDLY